MEKTVGIIISVGVAVLLGIILVQIISTQTVVTTQTKTVTETHNLYSNGCYQVPGQVNVSTDADCNLTIVNIPTGWKVNDCPLSSIAVTNNAGTGLTLDTDYYLFSTTGIVQMLNTSATNFTALGPTNNTKITYTYCGDDYINQSWGRNVLNLVPGFFVLAILIGAAFVIFWILKEQGIDFNI